VADASSLSTSLLALAAMVVAMAALPWGLRRWQQRNQMARGVVQAQIQVLGALAVGPGQRIVTVQVQRNEQTTCLVLGVTAHNIQCLHVLGESAQSASLTPETITPSAQSATHFAQTLVAEQGKDS
jgi:flagellar protein FliO/FliZ